MSNIVIQTNHSAPRKIHVLAGVVRRVGNKWIILNDEGHAPAGLNPIVLEPTNKSLQIMFDKKYSQVLTCSITADETYAERGIVFGGSVGFDKVIIKHSKAGVPVTNAELNIANSNIWIYIMMYE